MALGGMARQSGAGFAIDGPVRRQLVIFMGCLLGASSAFSQMALREIGGESYPARIGAVPESIEVMESAAFRASFPVSTNPVPIALARIPSGSFTMGNSFTNLAAQGIEGYATELPLHEVEVSEFFIGRFEITNEEMARALQWAYEQGRVAVTNVGGLVCAVNTEGTNSQRLLYLSMATSQIVFTNDVFAVMEGKTNFPCFYVTWYGALAYCNYLSAMEGLPPAVDFNSWAVNIASTGYRLPAEAEWEKACRGGAAGTHFPWPNDSSQGTNFYLYSVDPRKANQIDYRYRVTIDGTNYLYLNQPKHPWSGEPVKTTPVGYYDGAQVVTNWTTNVVYRGDDYGQTNDMGNGYGLYDMGGNVYEWCLDYMVTNWYSKPESTMPDAVATNESLSFHSYRVFRGGGWTHYFPEAYNYDPSALRCSFRASYPATEPENYLGFRVARRPTEYETWALGEGLNPLATNGVAEADFDGDGFLNGDEKIVGTQPTNPASIFKVGGVEASEGGVSLAYWGMSGRVYTVESKTNLLETSAWQFHAEVTNETMGASQIPVETGEVFRALRIKARLAP